MSVMLLVSIFLVTTYVSAGVGISLTQQSILVFEGEENCIIYSVYNPFPGTSTVKLEVSEELKDILKSQGSDTVDIPAETGSDSAIPVNFCFKVPRVYEMDCAIGNFLCKQTCHEERKEYVGEVLVQTIPSDGSGSGSATKATVSAPLTVRVQCQESRTNYTIIYALIALISAGITVYLLSQKNAKKKPSKKKPVKKK